MLWLVLLISFCCLLLSLVLMALYGMNPVFVILLYLSVANLFLGVGRWRLSVVRGGRR
jgi:hypothetical protein